MASEMSRPHPAIVAAGDQMRAEALHRLREAPLFFVSLGDDGGQHLFGSLWARESVSLGFLVGTIVSAWEWLGEVSGESDAEIVQQVLLTLAARRDGVDADGGGADDY